MGTERRAQLVELTDPESARAELLRDERMLPECVQELLCRGRLELAAQRRAEADRRERERQDQLAAAVAALEPVKADALRAHPDLARVARFCEWGEERIAGTELTHLREVYLRVKVPGFAAVSGAFVRDWLTPDGPNARGEWGPWALYGRWSVPGPRTTEGYPSLDLALAAAREAWLDNPRRADAED